LASLRASPLVNELLRDWSTGEIATQSDSVYALQTKAKQWQTFPLPSLPRAR
jgi:hypothetical protein